MDQTYDIEKFRRWYHSKFEEQKKRSPNLTLRKVAAQAGINYWSLWKAVAAEPSKYPEHTQMKFENVLRIGRYFDDVAGAMEAAGVSIPGSVLAALESDPDNIEPELKEILTAWPELSPAMRQPILDLVRAGRRPSIGKRTVAVVK